MSGNGMRRRTELLDEVELFVLDMDGTFYLEDQILEGALDFIEAVRQKGKRFLFFTNNSSRSSEYYKGKLARMNCLIADEEIMTSGDVTVQYLNTYYRRKRVYLVGTPELESSFRQGGVLLTEEPPDIVVVGFDTTLNYGKLERACTYIRQGALFLATHIDINCPTKTGFIPDCGAFCAAITLSTGVKPKYLGKPFKETVEMVLDRTGAKRERTAFIGDRLYTDVAAGVQNGARGFLVLTGETHLADIEASDVKPDEIYESLGEMGRLLQSGAI